MRTTLSRTVVASVSGALALSLLLAGCSSSDEPADEATTGAPDGTTAEAAPTETSRAELTGAVALPASCDDVTTTLGDAVAGLTLDAASGVEGDQINCSWSDAAEGATSRVLLTATTTALSDDEVDEAAASNLPGAAIEEVDDERLDDFDGRAFVAEPQQAGQQGVLAFVSTPQGAVAFGSLSAGEVPSADEALDLAFEFVD